MSMVQNIVWGIEHLQHHLQGSAKSMIVCGRSLSSLSIKEDIELLKTNHLFFSDFAPNPLYESIEKGIDLFNQEGCDTLIAVGGGSAIDVAKCIKLFCRMSDGKPYLQQRYEDTGVKLIAIPTTAGSGSESTQHAVIYYQGQKQSISHESILPNIAILEPSVLATLPFYQKKCTMLDALCQGIESWWSVNSTDESKEYSKIAVETIMANWRAYIFDNSPAAAKEIMLAANYAGRAINITQTTAPHAFSYKLTSLYGLPHGHAVAVCLPVIWEYMINHLDKCIDKRGAEYLSQVFFDIASALQGENAATAIAIFQSLLKDLELIHPFDSASTDHIEILADSVNPVRLKNNPVRLEMETIQKLYQHIILN